MPRLTPDQLRKRRTANTATPTRRRTDEAAVMRARLAKAPARVRYTVRLFASIDGYERLDDIPANRLRRYIVATRAVLSDAS